MQTPPVTSPAPPPRPDAASRTLRRERRWFPTIVVAAVIATVVTGGYLAAQVLSTPEGAPQDVGGLVRVQPISDWEAVGPLNDGAAPGIRFTRGSGTFDVFAAPVAEDERALARFYASQVLEPAASRFTISPNLENVSVGGGLTGLRFSYIGVFGDQSSVPIEGEATVVVTPSGAGVVFDGWAPEGLLRFVLGDVHTMIDRASVT